MWWTPRNTSSRPRVLLVQEFLLGPGDPGSTRAYGHLLRLRAAGVSACALAGPWNPLTGRRVCTREDGAAGVRRIALPPPGRGFSGRALGQAGSALALLPALLAHARAADLILFSSPPLLPGLACALAARASGIPLVVEWRDLWPEAGIALGRLGPGGLPARLLAAAARLVGETACAHVALTPGIAERIARRHPGKPLLLLPNRPDRAELAGPAGAAGANGAGRRALPLAVAWFGHLNDGNDAALLPALARAARGLAEFHLFGDGPLRPRLRAEAGRGDLPNLRLRGPVPRRDLPRALAAMDAALVCLPRDPAGFLDCVLPNKLADAMGFGLPVLLIGGGDAARELIASGAGIVIPRGPSELPGAVDALRRLAASPALRRELAQAGRARIRTLGTREETGDRLAGFLREILRRKKSRECEGAPPPPPRKGSSTP